MGLNPQETADLVTFTEEIVNGKLHFLRSAIKIPERHHWHRSGILIVNFEHISHLALVFL